MKHKTNAGGVVVRFAPSLSGNIHLGNLRILFYNWLFYIKNKKCSTLILRIENSNLKDNFKNLLPILECMEDFKLYWTRGPLLEKSKMYFQCMRSQIYLYYLKRLALMGLTSKVYKEKAIYLKLTDFYIKLGYANFIIYRANIKPVFNFVNPIDDIDLQITHVIRGEDHRSNFIKHILLFKILRVQIPNFIHVPLLLNPFNRSKLSKKNKVFSIRNFARKGILTNAILNLLFLSNFTSENEFLTLNKIVDNFSINGLNNRSSSVDICKLYFLNKKHIQSSKVSDYLFNLKNFLKKKKIFQIKNIRNFSLIYVKLKKTIDKLSAVSNLFLKKKINISCTVCSKYKFMFNKNKDRINFVTYCLTLKKKNILKIVRAALIGSFEGNSAILLAKFYSKVH